MNSGIRISKKHGVNPMIPTCFFCGKQKNEIMLFGLLPNDAEAPRSGVINMEPCETCIDYMKQGVMLVSVRDGEKGDNPYRTGNMVVIKEKAAKELFGDAIRNSRFAFVEDATWLALGLPRE